MLQLTDEQEILLLIPNVERLRTYVREDIDYLLKKGAFPPNGPYVGMYSMHAKILVDAGIAERYGRRRNLQGERDESIRGPFRYRLTISKDGADYLLENY